MKWKEALNLKVFNLWSSVARFRNEFVQPNKNLLKTLTNWPQNNWRYRVNVADHHYVITFNTGDRRTEKSAFQ